MKNKILLTAVMALIGLFSFSTMAEAHHGRGGRGKHKHVFHRYGNRTIVWHNNYNQCGNGWGYNNYIGNQMCIHMRNGWRGGRNGGTIVRCNHRGCGMFGSSFRNGRFYNNHRGHGHYSGRYGYRGGRYNQGGGRGNGRYNQGGGRGNGRYNQGGGRGTGRGQGGGRGRGNGKGNGRGGR